MLKSKQNRSLDDRASLARRLSAEAVEGLSLSLEGVDDVHGRDGLAAGVLGVGDRVADDVLEEHLRVWGEEESVRNARTARPLTH